VPELRDIDTLHDLKMWMNEVKTGGSRAVKEARPSRTRRYCEDTLARELGL
jgi:hypothetical protein